MSHQKKNPNYPLLEHFQKKKKKKSRRTVPIHSLNIWVGNCKQTIFKEIDVKISIFLNSFKKNEWILIKCLCIDIYDPCCD